MNTNRYSEQVTTAFHPSGGKYPYRRGEGGEEWRGVPLWSPAVLLKDGDSHNIFGPLEMVQLQRMKEEYHGTR